MILGKFLSVFFFVPCKIAFNFYLEYMMMLEIMYLIQQRRMIKIKLQKNEIILIIKKIKQKQKNLKKNKARQKSQHMRLLKVLAKNIQKKRLYVFYVNFFFSIITNF